MPYLNSMATPQPAGMGFEDYQTYLLSVIQGIEGGNFTAAFSALAQAEVVLAGLPQEIITGQQTTKFRMLKELDGLRASITQAQIAAQTNGGGMGIGLFSIRRAQ